MGFLSDIIPALGAAGGASLGALAGGPQGALTGASIGTSASSSLSNAEGVRDANNANRDMALSQMEFNRAEAVKNRDYQTEMSNTQHQRTMADLKKAGLNPMLAMGASNSSPSGATASSGSSAAMQNQKPDFSRAVMTALEAKMADQNLENLKMNNELTKSAVRKTKAEAGIAETTQKDLDQTVDAKINPNMIDAASGTKTVSDYYREKARMDKEEFNARSAAARRDRKTSEFQDKNNSLLNIMDTIKKGTDIVRPSLGK